MLANLLGFRPIMATPTGLGRRLGFRLIDHRLELYGVPVEDETN